MVSPVILCASLLGLQRPFPNRPLSFECPATSARAALVQLSTAAELKLVANASIANEILVLRFDNVPLSEALAKVAAVTHAHWELQGETYVLKRDASDAATIRADLKARFLRLMRSSLPQVAQSVAKAPEISDSRALSYVQENMRRDPASDQRSYAQVREEQLQRSPETRALVRILNGIGPERIAEVLSEKRSAVFATHATSLQYSITIDPSILSTFLRERNAFSRALRKVRPADGDTDDPETQLSDADRFPISKELPSKVLLGIQGTTSRLSVHLQLYDERGKLVGFKFWALSAPEMAGLDAREETPLKPAVYATELAGYFQGSRNKNRPYSAALTQRLLNPEAFEPLSLYWSDLLLGIARQRKTSLVANLPDTPFLYTGLSGTGDMVSSRILKFIAARANLEKEPRWIVISPFDPVDAAERRVDRKLLGPLLRAANADGRVTLDAAVDYAGRTKTDDLGATVLYLGLVSHEPQGDYPGEYQPLQASWDILRLYGSLSEQQRVALSTGMRVSFASLSNFQRQCVIDSAHDLFPEAVDDGTGVVATDLGCEPTQIFAHGLDSSGWIDANVEQEVSIESQEEDDEGVAYTSDTSLSTLILMSNLEKQAKIESSLPEGSLVPRKTTFLTLQLHLAPGIAMSETLIDNKRFPDQAFTRESIPAAIRSEWERLLREDGDGR